MVLTGWPVSIAVELATARRMCARILDFVGSLFFIGGNYSMPGANNCGTIGCTSGFTTSGTTGIPEQ